MRSPRTLRPIERVSPDDLMSMATDRGSVPLQVGAVLILQAPEGIDGSLVGEVLDRRVRRVSRLRQRLVAVPWGCGRPVWVDHAEFSVAQHLRVVRCPPGGESAVLEVAADLLLTRLPRDRPLWSATLLTDVDAGAAALIFVFHHVLADGIGGLAVLAGLVDGPADDVPAEPPRRMASRRQLMVDAAQGHLRSPGRIAPALRRLRDAARQLRPTVGGRVAASSLNRATGPGRRLAVVRADLDRIHQASHAHQATVNDVALAAIAAALHRLLAGRGEQVAEFVISVPFSARRGTTGGDLGNHSGVIPLHIRGIGGPMERLVSVAQSTRAAKHNQRGASTALLGPVFRLLAATGLYGRFIDRQRLINTFVTNLPGPRNRLSFLNCPITSIVPLTAAAGNVTISFAVLSYAGELVITVIADPATCPDLSILRDVLEQEVDVLTAAMGRRRASTSEDRTGSTETSSDQWHSG